MNVFEILNSIIDFIKDNLITTKTPCGTINTKLPLEVNCDENKEMAKFDFRTGKCYWPSDGSYAEGPGIRNIPNKEN